MAPYTLQKAPGQLLGATRAYQAEDYLIDWYFGVFSGFDVLRAFEVFEVFEVLGVLGVFGVLKSCSWGRVV